NYLFDLAILSLTAEDESLAMLWISDRRNPKHDAMVANAHAPKAWQQWVKYGSPEIERIKRRVARYHIVRRQDQVMPASSTIGKTLDTVYRFYEGKKHR